MSDQIDERPARVSPGAAAGITETMIDKQVRTFYARVQADETLGPIFARVVTDWEDHLLRLIDFWSSVLLMSGRYKGRPVPKHMPLNLQPAHFARWLALFAATANEVCPPQAALLFQQKAAMIAESLQLSAAVVRGGLPPQRNGTLR